MGNNSLSKRFIFFGVDEGVYDPQNIAMLRQYLAMVVMVIVGC
jgi:hypothetical protein